MQSYFDFLDRINQKLGAYDVPELHSYGEIFTVPR
jgi:hypothetical protein